MRMKGRKIPGRVRLARIRMGASLEAAVSTLDTICHEQGILDGIGLSRGELSKVERAQRWIKAEQLAAMAIYFGISPGELCEWLLQDRGLVESDS